MLEELKGHLNTGRLHHAYLLSGSSEKILSSLEDFLKDIFPEAFDVKTHPDVLWLVKERLDKNDARFLRGFQSGKAFAGKDRFIVIAFSAMAPEAQEVLLKTLEEPAIGLHFFIVVPTVEFFRPTVLSRVYQIKVLEDEKKESFLEVEKFLSLDVADRGDYLIKTFLIDGQIKDREFLFSWLDYLEVFIREQTDLKRISDNLITVFAEIANARKMLNKQRASAKMILEYLALIVPAIRKVK